MKNGLQHFPDLGEWTDEDIGRAGYQRRSLSIFDHWLSPEEAEFCQLFSFDEAAAAGLLPTYLEQENRFISFYRAVFAAGAYRRRGVGRWPRVGVTFHYRWDRRLKKAVRHSLRDRVHMDVFAPEFSLRVVGNWDRSDVLLFSESERAEVENIARCCGLFII